MLSRVHPMVEGENSHGRKTKWHRVSLLLLKLFAKAAISCHKFSLVDLAESVGVPSGSMLKALPCHHWMVARPKDSGSLSKRLHRNKCNRETILSMYGMFAYTFVMHKSSYRNPQSWIDRQEYSSQCALKKVERAWKQTKRQRQSPIQSFLPQNCPCKCEPAPELTVVPAAFVWDCYSGQIIVSRYVKCKSSPQIPEIQWITLQPNRRFCSTNIPTSFDSQFWTSIDSLSVPFASHCTTRRRYSPVQISFLPCPVGRLKWPQSSHHPLKPSKDDWVIT